MAKQDFSPEKNTANICDVEYLSRQISRSGVASGDSGVAPQQQVMHGSAYNLTAANHHSFLPCHRHACRECVTVSVNSVKINSDVSLRCF